MNLDAVCAGLKAASVRLALCTAEEKNRALLGVSAAIDAGRTAILSANGRDVANARAAGMKETLVSRLLL